MTQPRELRAGWDGDQGPLRDFYVYDGSGVRDFATAVAEFVISTEDGVDLGTRPAVIQGAKSAGKVRLHMKGYETDWEGAGKYLLIRPRLYYATTPAGVPASNLLLNSSFDAGAGSVADSWATFGGGPLGTYALTSDDPMPPTIFGKAQSVAHSVAGDPDNLAQSVNQATAVGDEVSAGVWVRGSGVVVTTQANVRLQLSALGGVSDVYSADLPAGTFDWRFVTVTGRIANSGHTSLQAALLTSGAAGSWRFDDAFAFVGHWNVVQAEAMRVRVGARPRPPRATGNMAAGVGGFEQDSNADGLADGFANLAAGVTFAMDRDPANVSEGSASQKVTLADPSGKRIRVEFRGRYKAGETWRVRLKAKTAGALAAGVGTGGLSLGLATEDFDGASQSATTNLSTNAAVFTDHAAQVALTADRSALVVDVNLNGYAGTLWLDDLRLDRTVAP